MAKQEFFVTSSVISFCVEMTKSHFSSLSFNFNNFCFDKINNLELHAINAKICHYYVTSGYSSFQIFPKLGLINFVQSQNDNTFLFKGNNRKTRKRRIRPHQVKLGVILFK